MKTIILLIGAFFALTCSVYATPSLQDTAKANGLLNALTNTQASYKEANGKYEQVTKKWKDHMTYEMDEYLGPEGAGYIARVTKVVDGKKYIIERHVGPETDRNIATDWEYRRI